MKIIRSIKAMQDFSKKAHKSGKIIGFVPTMGALHEGHLSLLRKSKKENDITVLSIFVNPTQFGPKEDFKKYPRPFKKDKRFAKKENIDIMFFPSAVEMYKNDFTTYVEPGKLAKGLCGPFRPGHFRGVTTVVTKLLNAVLPDVMYLGQKDAQQAVILQRMAEDLNFPVSVKILPTVREKDGLAMSSRNIYLNPQDRKNATVIFKSLKEAQKLIRKERSASQIKNFIRNRIQSVRPQKIDYVECVDVKTLDRLGRIKGKILLAVAVWFGKTRLIDNIVVAPPTPSQKKHPSVGFGGLRVK